MSERVNPAADFRRCFGGSIVCASYKRFVPATDTHATSVKVDAVPGPETAGSPGGDGGDTMTTTWTVCMTDRPVLRSKLVGPDKVEWTVKSVGGISPLWDVQCTAPAAG